MRAFSTSSKGVTPPSPMAALRSLGSQLSAVPGGENVSNTFKTESVPSSQFLLKFYTLAELDKFCSKH